ncbi:MAG TPA: hypothetical protein VKA00_06430 [Trueperaceae bacterium]|nr:hypothetical protein [Trueperaceae bacterium]
MHGADIAVLAGLGLLALLLAGALAPLEALGWWAGWFGRRSEEHPVHVEGHGDEPPARHFVVFLSGIHSVAERAFARREVVLLERLRERLADARVLEVFPYSVTNHALTAERVFSRFWRWALKMKLSRRALAQLAGMVINLRNLWQVAVSADRRYGPIYNHGSAELITEALLAAGYVPASGTRVTLIGYSGGGQIALGAAGHLDEILGAPVDVIALGGVMASDPAALQVRHLYYLYGDRDAIHRIGTLFFAGRWPLVRYSPWNQARAKGLVTNVRLGPMGHMGRDGYLSTTAMLPDGRSHLDATVDAISKLIGGNDNEVRQAA